jgi:hypothetical protein
MSDYADRRSARDALLALAPDLDEAIDALRLFEPSTSGASVQLGRATVLRVLDAFTRGDLSPALLERWAEAVHSADDIELDSTDRDFLAEALFELSTPDLFGSMDDIVARFRERGHRPAHG